MAMATNPFAPTVPCHRVVRTDLTLGGYSGPSDGCSSLHFKRDFLRSEGVKFVPTAPGAPFKVAPESLLAVISVPAPSRAVLDAFSADIAAGHTAYLASPDTEVAKAFAKHRDERAAAAATTDTVTLASGMKAAAPAGGKKAAISSPVKRTAAAPATVAPGADSEPASTDAAVDVKFAAKRARAY
jgi:hypothetical protein